MLFVEHLLCRGELDRERAHPSYCICFALKAVRHLSGGFEAKRLERSDGEIMVDEELLSGRILNPHGSALLRCDVAGTSNRACAHNQVDIALNCCARCCFEVVDWDWTKFREATVLLSFSLVKVDETGHRISMHPLVHVWARGRLSEELQRQY